MNLNLLGSNIDCVMGSSENGIFTPLIISFFIIRYLHNNRSGQTEIAVFRGHLFTCLFLFALCLAKKVAGHACLGYNKFLFKLDPTVIICQSVSLN